MTEIRYRAAPRSKNALDDLTGNIREALGIETPDFPILPVLENILPCIPGHEEFHIQIVDDCEMRAEGLTLLDEPSIVLPLSVYEAANAGDGRARFTVAHEFGHYLLHRPAGLARELATSNIRPYEDTEWQANYFAGALLVPKQLINTNDNAQSISQRFSVSVSAAETRLKQIRKV